MKNSLSLSFHDIVFQLLHLWFFLSTGNLASQNSRNRRCSSSISTRGRTVPRKYEISLSTIVHLLFIIINIVRGHDNIDVAKSSLNHRVQIEALAATKQCCPILLFQPHTSNFNLTLKLGASKFLRSFIGNLQYRDVQCTRCNNGNFENRKFGF